MVDEWLTLRIGFIVSVVLIGILGILKKNRIKFNSGFTEIKV